MVRQGCARDKGCITTEEPRGQDRVFKAVSWLARGSHVVHEPEREGERGWRSAGWVNLGLPNFGNVLTVLVALKKMSFVTKNVIVPLTNFS